MSEFGFQSFPEPKTVETYTTPEDRASVTTPVMRLHQKNGDGHGNEKIAETITNYFRKPKDFDSTLWLSQMLQAYGIQYGVEHWRRDWPKSTGSLIWQYNDCWPVASWAAVDYGGNWKALMYAARHFYSPLLVSATANAAKRQADVYICNDLKDASKGTVSWSLTDLAGTELDKGSSDVDIPAGTSSTKVQTIDLKDQMTKAGKQNVLLWLKLVVDGQTVSQNLLTFVRAKVLALQDPALTADVTKADDGYDVTVTAAHPALYTWLELQDTTARYSDNFVHLRAHEPVTIHVTPATPMSLDDVRKALHVRSLFDTYDATEGATADNVPISDGVPVVASSVTKEGGDELIAENVVDGDEGTRWSSASSDNQWIYVDLGSSKSITDIKLDWEHAAGKDYDIEVSDDAQNWTLVKSVTGNKTTGWLDYPNLNTKGRYVRLNCKTRTTQYGFSLFEFQVFGS